VSDPDATLLIEPDEPAFLRHIESMVTQMEARFKKSGGGLKSVLQGGGSTGSGNWQQSPMVQTTKEMEKQSRWAKEILKTERDRRDVDRARRFESNRSKYGDGVELDENGNVKKDPNRQASARRRTVGHVAGGINAASTLAFGGGSMQSSMSAMAQIGGMIAPEAAPILNAVAGAAMTALNAADTRVEAGLRGYQVGGFKGANQVLGSDAIDEEYRKLMGFDFERFSNLQTHLGRKTGATNDMRLLMGMENAFGLGGQGVNLLGASARSGHSPTSQNQDKALGSAMGLAMSQSLERGRLGEVFDQLTQAMDQNTKGVADVGSIADRFLFISQLGAQYRGNSSASREMSQGIQSLARGDKPYTQMSMLRASGFGKAGVSYAQAWLTSQTGLDVQGGISSEQIIMSNFSSYIPSYARGNEKQKASIVMIISQLTGMNGAQVKAIMDRLASGPMAHVDAQAGRKALGAEAAMNGEPESLLRTRKEKTNAESAKAGVGGFLHWLGGKGDQRGGISQGSTTTTYEPGGGSNGGGGGVQTSQGTAGGAQQSQFSQYRSQGGRFGIARGDTGGMQNGVHPGEDLFFPPNTTIYSPCNGRCVVAGYFAMPGQKTNEANGWAVWIRSTDDGKVWQFVHLKPDTVQVRRGSAVRRGDKLGTTLGFDKWSNGVKTHLHLGVQQGGQQTDPMQFDLSGIVTPSTTRASGGGSSGGPMTAPGATTAPASAPGSGGGSATGGANAEVKVSVTINDRTQHGVDVSKETSAFKAKAQEPAPGDAPATHPD
jgi:hypothetical protein